ncbi:unnamed protein product, partial [marine sediment metagenome]
ELIPREQDDCLRFVRNPYKAKEVLPPGQWIQVHWITEDQIAYGIYETQGLSKKEDRLYLGYVTERIGKRQFKALTEYNKMLRSKAEVKRYVLYIKGALKPQGGDKA